MGGRGHGEGGHLVDGEGRGISCRRPLWFFRGKDVNICEKTNFSGRKTQ